MDQEKFVNSYIDLLNTTLSEAIQKNIVLQVQKKLAETELSGIQNNLNGERTDLLEKIKKTEESVKVLEDQKNSEILSLKNSLAELKNQRDAAVNENTELKKVATHVDTFKEELVKNRNELSNSNSEISKRQKHIDELSKSNSEFVARINALTIIVNDTKTENQKLVKQIDDLKVEKSKLENDRLQKQKDVDLIAKQYNDIVNKNNELNNKISEVLKNNSNLSENLALANSEIEKLTLKIDSLVNPVGSNTKKKKKTPSLETNTSQIVTIKDAGKF